MDFNNFSDAFISLATLTFLEIVLGIDNLVFISLASQRLPLKQQKAARRLGLLAAWVTRLALLLSAVWLASLSTPLFSFGTWHISSRDLFMMIGGLFLIYKAGQEIYRELIAAAAIDRPASGATFAMIILQIGLLDLVFSFDSIMTAIGLTQKFWIMATAITIAILTMIFASEPLTRFVHQYATVRMLALSFLILIGGVLIADGFHIHISKAYLYFAIGFSVAVEALNLIRQKRCKSKATEP